MDGQYGLVEVSNQFVVGLVVGVIGSSLVWTTLGKKVVTKGAGAVERKLGL